MGSPASRDPVEFLAQSFETLLLGTVLFAATNADDLVILVFFFAQPRHGSAAIVIGQVAGIGVLVAVSAVASVAAAHLPAGWIALLGLVPLGMGLWSLRGGGADDDPKPLPDHRVILGVAAVTIANGGDNLGVYIPTFAIQPPGQVAVLCGLFLVLTLVLCLFAHVAVRHPRWRAPVTRWSERLSPWILIVVGLWILARHPIVARWFD